MPLNINRAALRRPLLPEHPGAWLRSRARIYLVVLGCVIAGFFFVAGWITTPAEDSGLGRIGFWQTVVAVAALVLAWLTVRWGDRQKRREGAPRPRYH
jgi:hypothetical protein